MELLYFVIKTDLLKNNYY